MLTWPRSRSSLRRREFGWHCLESAWRGLEERAPTIKRERASERERERERESEREREREIHPSRSIHTQIHARVFMGAIVCVGSSWARVYCELRDRTTQSSDVREHTHGK